jgi:hypothetical protein
MTPVILYDEEDLLRWRQLQGSGVVPKASWYPLLVLGRYSG